MSKKLLLIIVVITLVIGVGTFYGGMKYGQSRSPLSKFSPQNFQNLSPEQRQQSFQGRVERGTGANFLNGEVIAKDEQSLTLKMPDGSSRIIFFSDSTKITKLAEGSLNNLEVGKTVLVGGKQNSDGSFTAQTIQLSP